MRVINIHKEKHTHYIGRGSIFGNPYVIGRDGSRSEVILKYKNYAIANSGLMKAIRELTHDAVLGCFCHPNPCHGDVIMELYGN